MNLSKGDFFGEMALVIDEPRSANVEVSESTVLAFFLHSDLKAFVEQFPRCDAIFTFNLSRRLARRLRETIFLLLCSKVINRQSMGWEALMTFKGLQHSRGAKLVLLLLATIFILYSDLGMNSGCIGTCRFCSNVLCAIGVYERYPASFRFGP